MKTTHFEIHTLAKIFLDILTLKGQITLKIVLKNPPLFYTFMGETELSHGNICSLTVWLFMPLVFYWPLTPKIAQIQKKGTFVSSIFLGLETNVCLAFPNSHFLGLYLTKRTCIFASLQGPGFKAL